MLNLRLAGDYLYGKLLFTWLSVVMSSHMLLASGLRYLYKIKFSSVL